MSIAYDTVQPGRCPACASHGVISKEINVPVPGHPDWHTKETRDVPCGWCTGGTGPRQYEGAL